MTGRRRGKGYEARPRLPPRERALVALLLLNVVWLAFALGGVRLWGELPAVALSLATLFLLPRWERGEIPGAGSPVGRLLRLPLFWCGLGLYVWFYIQSWNLAWEWTTIPNGRPKLISRPPLIDWLPSSMNAPFDENNPVRTMLFYTIPWIACCSAWAGLMTRRSVGWLLHGLAAIGIVFGLVALWQHFSGQELILGLFPTVPSRAGKDFPFWGTLINSNHGAFYLILTNALCLGLFLSGWHRDLRQFRKRGGAWLLYLGFSFLTTFSILMAQARAAILIVALQWLLFLIICSVFFIRRFGLRGVAFPLAVVALTASVTGLFVANPAVFEQQKEEWIRTFDLVQNPEAEARYYMTQIAWDMIHDRPWLGHGAGSFRYVHFPYLQTYPEFKTQHYRWIKNPVTGKHERRLYTIWFQNAHVDLLEYFIEWGIIGCLFPFMAAAWLFYRGLRAWRGWDAGGIALLMGLGVVWLGAAVEFHFRIPLVLLAWCLSLTAVVKLAELQARGGDWRG